MMRRPAARFAAHASVLLTAIAILVAHSQLQADEPAGASTLLEGDAPLPLDLLLAADSAGDQELAEPASGPSPFESTLQPAGDATGVVARGVYPAFAESCRQSRVYRSEILGRLWVRGEYLNWATKGVDLPPLVTTGVLGQPGTSILFGDRLIHHEMSSGGRLTGGFWWDPSQTGGVEASYFELDGEDLEHRSRALRGQTTIARPYWNVNTASQDADLVADPGTQGGMIDVRLDMELLGAEVLLRRVASRGPAYRLDVLAGYRYGRLSDELLITDWSISPPRPAGGPYVDGTIETERFDLFKSLNDFHGGEAGLAARWKHGRWSVDLLGKVALGGSSTRITIGGETTTTTTTIVGPDTTTTTETRKRGLLALRSNKGYFSDTKLAVLSELGTALRYEITCDLWFSVGYNLLHWSRVGRAADQIDLRIDPTQIPPGGWANQTRPRFSLRTTDFWAQGLTLGLEHQF